MTLPDKPSLEEVAYSVDDLDRINWVSDTWDAFAERNNGPAAHSSAVLGTSLWKHVTQITLQLLLRQLFSRVRATGNPMLLSCRCDSPALRRDLRLRIESPDGKVVAISSATLSETPYSGSTSFSTPDILLTQCSWCNNILAGGSWVDLEEAVISLRLLHGPHFPLISHGLCPRCKEGLYKATGQ